MRADFVRTGAHQIDTGHFLGGHNRDVDSFGILTFRIQLGICGANVGSRPTLSVPVVSFYSGLDTSRRP